MSTSIHWTAVREIRVVKTGKTSTQEIHFNGLQTPTRVTWEIMESEIIESADPTQTYKDWVLRECSVDEEFPVYAEDDVLCENPIGVEIYNAGKEHIEKFDAWLKMCEEEGFEVRPVAW